MFNHHCSGVVCCLLIVTENPMSHYVDYNFESSFSNLFIQNHYQRKNIKYIITWLSPVQLSNRHLPLFPQPPTPRDNATPRRTLALSQTLPLPLRLLLLQPSSTSPSLNHRVPCRPPPHPLHPEHPLPSPVRTNKCLLPHHRHRRQHAHPSIHNTHPARPPLSHARVR